MPLNEQQFAAHVVKALEKRELPSRIANRLMTARARALEAAARASPAGGNTLVLSRRGLVGLLGAFLLLLAAGVWYSNNMSASDADYIDIDAAVLSGDLPVHAYLDRGFEAYLHRTSSTQ
jgi:uncharacterized protein DUF3619